jgi:Putative adhesin
MRTRGLWIAVAVLTAVVVLVPTGVSTWGKVNQTSEPVRHDFGAASALTVDVGAGEAVIQAGRTGQVTLRGTLTWSLFKPVVTWSWSRGALAIAVRCGPRTPVPVSDVLGSGCWGVVLRLTVPPGLAVTAAASSGEVLAQGLAGPLRLTATTGSIDGTGLGSARVTAGLTSGEISLSFARPPSAVAATVTSGSVQIAVPDRSRYRVASRAGSGSVTVAGGLADGSARRRIGVSVGSGSVSVGYTGA